MVYLLLVLLQMWSSTDSKPLTGLYEQQDADQPDHNLRGKFYTDEAGKYAYYGLRPTPYPVGTSQNEHSFSSYSNPLAGPW